MSRYAAVSRVALLCFKGFFSGESVVFGKIYIPRGPPFHTKCVAILIFIILFLADGSYNYVDYLFYLCLNYIFTIIRLLLKYKLM